ncbi:hypothetical protein CLOM_g18136, partial [Closterium sp. NIES-68]
MAIHLTGGSPSHASLGDSHSKRGRGINYRAQISRFLTSVISGGGSGGPGGSAKPRIQLGVALAAITFVWLTLGCWLLPFSCPFPRGRVHKRRTPANFTSDIFNRQLPDAISTALKLPWKKQPVPVVVIHQQPSGSVACHPKHYMHRNLRHTRQRNAVVYFIGPDSDECVEMARELDIVLDPVIGYQDVVGWFSANLGDPVSYQ